jgi:hypothetical protein
MVRRNNPGLVRTISSLDMVVSPRWPVDEIQGESGDGRDDDQIVRHHDEFYRIECQQREQVPDYQAQEIGGQAGFWLRCGARD